MFNLNIHKKLAILSLVTTTFFVFIFTQSPFNFIWEKTIQENSDIRIVKPSIKQIDDGKESLNSIVDQSKENIVNPPKEQLEKQETSTIEKENWRIERGYSMGEYESYSEEILLSLAKSGDMRALIALGNLRSGTMGYDGAAPAYINAAIRGSTAALLRLALIEESSHYDKAKSAEERKKYSLKILAWYHLASLRGDKSPEIINGRYFIESKGIVVTELDNKKIQSIADKFYKDMQNSRSQLGLGDFDNSAPDSIKNFQTKP